MEAYPVYYHANDVQALKQMLAQRGMQVYVIDKQKHAKAYKHTSLKFVVDSTVQDLREALSDLGVAWKPASDHAQKGFVEAVGPRRQSIINIDVLSHVYSIFVQELFQAMEENWAAQLLEALQDSGLLRPMFPELADTVSLDGGPYHAETVFEHLVNALRHSKEYPPMLQLAVLLHDIGKPATCETKKGPDGKPAVSFHKHEVVGAGIAFNVCKKMGLHPADTHYVVKMVRHHMYRFEDDSTDKSVCKWLFKVGKADWEDLFHLRIADRKGNVAKLNRPAITQKMKELRTRIERLIATIPAIFREDVVLSEEEIRGLIGKNTDITEVYSSLIGIICNEPSRNNIQWLTAHLRKVYG